MRELDFDARNEDDTQRLAVALAACLPRGTCVALLGTLGAGKTRLVQFVAEAWGINPADVTSPTFVICQSYQAQQTLVHMDAYRLNDPDDLLELGVDEALESCGLAMVEWADRVRDGLPLDCFEIQIDITSDTGRRFRMVAHNRACEAALDTIRERLA